MIDEPPPGSVQKNAFNNPPNSPSKPRNRNALIIIVVIAITAVFLFCCCPLLIGAINSGMATPTPKSAAQASQTQPVDQVIPGETSAPIDTAIPEATETPANTSTPEPTEIPGRISPGTYLVGTDIKPGIYRGDAGAGIFGSCYWARFKDLSGELDAVLANANAVGQFYIEVKSTDYAIETRCALLPLESLPPVTELPQTIGPGVYLVGKDIQAGTYKGQAGTDISDSCYWARLKNVAGGLDAVIANENATGQFYIQVSQSDFALSTACELSLTKQ